MSVDVLKAEAIKRALRDTREEFESLEAEYKRAKRKLAEKVESLKEECPHPEWKYVPDASGNNDSYHYCTFCGKET